jgi:ribosomal protein S18 acetylase RimI-like enzyme
MIQQLRHFCHVALEDIRHHDLHVLLWRIVMALLSPLFDLTMETLHDIDLTLPVEARRPRADCRIEPASEADLEEILDMQPKLCPAAARGELSDDEEYEQALQERSRASVRRGFIRAWRAGEMCFVARIDGKIAHSNWIRFHDCAPVESRPIALMPGEVYTTDAYTADNRRGLRLHEAVVSHMLRYARERGCRRGYTISFFCQTTARQGVRRVGWKRRGEILYVRPRGTDINKTLAVAGDLEPMFRNQQREPAHR